MPATDVTSVRRDALIVATDKYEDPRLRALRAPARDAEELARVLGDPEIGDFKVGVSFNEPDHIVRRKISEFFRDRNRDDLLLLHISCHGLKDEDGTLYFANANTAVDLLEATATPSEFVNRQMTRSRSRRIVLLLDCCFGGAFARGMVHRAGDSVAIKEEFDGQGRVVLTASRAMEYAFEGDQIAGEATPSVFTSAIVEGLESGLADRDQDSRVSVDELYDFVYDRVREATPNQTPSKWTFDVQGDLYIARSPFSAAQPAELPVELRAAMESPFARVRAGAAEELAQLLASANTGFAAAARPALELLAHDDSRLVSEAASAALSGAVETSIQVASPPPARSLAPVATGTAAEPRPSATGRFAAILSYAARRQDALALVGAACIVLGYFRSASWSSAWTFAIHFDEEIWGLWSPLEVAAAILLVIGALSARHRRTLRPEGSDGVFLGVGLVIFVAMVTFVGSWLEFAGMSKWTWIGAVLIGAAGALGLLTRRGIEVELPHQIVPVAVAGIALLLAPLLSSVGASDATALTDRSWPFYVGVLAAGAVSILALVALIRAPRARLQAGGVLTAIGLLLAAHFVGIVINYGHDQGYGQIRFGGILGVIGGAVLVFAGVRVLRLGTPSQPAPAAVAPMPA